MTERERLAKLLERLDDVAVHKMLLFGFVLLPWTKDGETEDGQ